MLHHPLPARNQIERKFARGLHDRNMGVGVRNDDVYLRDIEDAISNTALCHQYMSGDGAQVFYPRNSANEEFRHVRRFHEVLAHSVDPKSRCCSPAHVQAGAYRAAPTRAVSRLFSLSSAYGEEPINAFNQGVSSSRPAIISPASHSTIQAGLMS